MIVETNMKAEYMQVYQIYEITKSFKVYNII